MAVDEAAGILAMRGQPRRTVHALGRLDMVMDVAVAEMAEGQRADAGEGGGEAARIFGNEARHQVHRDADIGLERRAVREDERSVGERCVGTCSTRWAPY